METFNGTGVKKQGRNWHILVPGGGKIGTFGQNIYPCNTKTRSEVLSIPGNTNN
jgi:hypothetical protein